MIQRQKIITLGLLPSMLFLTIFLICPFLYVVRLSLFDFNYAMSQAPLFAGFSNYVRLFRDPVFMASLKNTAIFAIVAVLGQFLLGLPIAILLNRLQRLRGLVLSVFLVPIMMAPAAVGIMWRYLLNSEFGVVTYYLNRLGICRTAILAEPATALIGVILVDIWHWTPFMVLVLLAGLASLPQEPFEAARVDGASGLQIFRYVTLPLLNPTIRVALLIRTIDAIKLFDEVFVLTEGGPGYCTETLALYAYRISFRYFDMGYGSAQVVLLVVTIMVLYSCLFKNLRLDSL